MSESHCRPVSSSTAAMKMSSTSARDCPLLASTTSVNNSGVVLTSAQTPAQTKAAADQLAPYLAAHRQSAMSGPFQMPGSDLRNVSLVQPAQ